MGRLGWIADYPTLDNFIFPNFYSTADNNYSRYNNPEVDAAIDDARKIADEDDRKDAYRKINQMVADDMLVVDLDGNIIEGTRKASVDTAALLYIFKNMPKVNAVIHTHQPYATGLGLVMDEIPCNLSTMANATEGPVNVAAYGDPGDISMGIEAVNAIGDRLAVVLKHHGVIAVGRDLRQALFSCVYLEEACKTIQVALSTGLPMATMTQEQIDEAVAVFHRYGQVTLNELDAAEAQGKSE